MRMTWISMGFAATALSALLAFTACGNSTTATTSSGGAGGVGGAGGSGTSCHDCACTITHANGGCSDICTMGLNGTTNPNFCDGSAALTQCAACISATCMESDPTACN